MFRLYFCIFFLSVFCSQSFAQGPFVLQNGIKDKINFKLINNLIVIPVEVNGAKLSFLLDTGISKPIIFNFLNLNEELKINQTERIYLRGLGEGESIEALKSKKNVFKIGKAVNYNQDLYAIFDPSLTFAPKLGLPIHGIIGYDLFKDFIIEVNYSSKYIKLYEPEEFKQKQCKSCKSLPLEFYNNKPYIYGSVSINGKISEVKLLIDSGGSDALWLFEDENIIVPNKFFNDFLGKGLSGSIYGKRSKLDKFSIAGFELEKINVAFPDSISTALAKKIKGRNGSLSGEVLKRFNIIFDYKKARIILRKNSNFSNPFFYNKSGITIEHSGVRVIKELNDPDLIYGNNSNNTDRSRITLMSNYRYLLSPAFTVVELREDSPAKKADIKIGDVILSVNGKGAHLYSLQDIVQMFYGDTGKRITLLIDRDGIQQRISFKLESLLK